MLKEIITSLQAYYHTHRFIIKAPVMEMDLHPWYHICHPVLCRHLSICRFQ
jgi:hypothetical protein